MLTTPSYGLSFNGSDACIEYPNRFSLVFKFKLESNRFAVTLYEVEGQLSVTLDACNSRLILNYGESSCAFSTISLSLKTELASGEWHKIGLSFSDDHLSLFVNCVLVEWRDLPGCRIRCREDTTINILTPNRQSSCSSFGEVMNIDIIPEAISYKKRQLLFKTKKKQQKTLITKKMIRGFCYPSSA